MSQELKIPTAVYNELLKTDVNELYKHLAIAVAGTETDVQQGLDNIRAIRNTLADMAQASPERTSDSITNLAQRGEALWNEMWPKVLKFVCDIYKSKKGDWVSAAVAAIAKAIGTTNPIALLVLAIGVKAGLDAICPDGSKTGAA